MHIEEAQSRYKNTGCVDEIKRGRFLELTSNLSIIGDTKHRHTYNKLIQDYSLFVFINRSETVLSKQHVHRFTSISVFRR